MDKEDKITLPIISEEERTPLVDQLLDIIRRLQKRVENLDSEVKRLKKHKGKPKIRASQLGKEKKSSQKSSSSSSKTPDLEIHRKKVIEVKDVPVDARFKGYKKYVVQDLEIKVVNTLFKLARWMLPNGSYITAELPKAYNGYHFGPTLRSYVLNQHHGQDLCTNILQLLLIFQKVYAKI